MQTNKTAYNLLLKNYFQYEKGRSELIKLFYRKALDNGKPVDCYINLNRFLDLLYKRNDYTIDDPMSIAASVINYCAHITAFFHSRFDIPTRIFVVYGNNRPEYCASLLNEYDAHNTMQRDAMFHVKELIQNNLEILEMLIPYIPDVYFIKDSAAEPGAIMRSMIRYQSSLGAKHARIIFTKDMYDYQLVGTCPNTHIMRVKKTMNGDKTFTVSYFDFYKKLLNIKTVIGEGISPELYSLYMTFAGCKDRNIKGIVTWPRADTIIKNNINAGFILNGYNPALSLNMASFRTFVASLTTDTDEALCDELYRRYCALDIVHQTNTFALGPSYAILNKGLVDLYDAAAVREINQKYFSHYPLDLNVF